MEGFFEEFAQFQLVNISPKLSKAVIPGEAVTPRATPGQSTPTAVEPRNSLPYAERNYNGRERPITAGNAVGGTRLDLCQSVARRHG